MYTYSITGAVNWNDAETEAGYQDISIDEIVEITEKSAQEAKDKFFQDNPQYDDFFGSMQACDAETYGKIWALYTDKTDNSRKISVELIGCN